MREYRSKQVDEELENQTFVYGGLYKKEGDKIEDSFITEYYIVDEHGRHIEVFEEFIGQYTGLNDKNGFKAFEGDKIYCDGCYMGYIELKNGAFNLIWEDNLQGSNGLNQERLNRMEIIGNIHDKEQGK